MGLSPKELLDNFIKGAPDHHTAAHLAVLYVLYVRLSNSDSEDRDVGDNKITLVESQTPLALYSFYSRIYGMELVPIKTCYQ